MSVEKLDTVKLLKEKIPYTIHSNYVLQNLCEPLPLAIWCYLTSLPDDWEVHRNQLMQHFGIGRDKLGTALKYLNENKLIEYLQAKFETGKFAISHIVVKNGVEFEVIHRNNTALLKNRTTDLPLSGESAPTNTIRNTNEIKNKNKSFSEQTEKAKSKKPDWKEANQTKHSWADGKKVSPVADVTKQSTSYDPDKYRNESKFDPESPGYKAFLDANPRIKRAREKREASGKAAQLPTGTAVPTEIPSREHASKESSEHALDGKSYFAPELRDSHRVMAPSSARSYLEKTGLAGEDHSASVGRM